MMVTGRSGFPIFINFPVTLELSITHNIFAAANTADFSLYGLRASSRSQIYFTQFLKSQPYPITLHAGYLSQLPLNAEASSLPQVFSGFANVAYSERSGGNVITRINAIDNGDIVNNAPSGFIDGSSSGSYTALAGTPFITVVQKLMSFLRNVKVGQVILDNMPAAYTRDRTFNGNAWEALQAIKPEGAHVFIENGICHMLGQNKTLTLPSLGVITASNGLLNIPKNMGSTVEVPCLFEPSLAIGRQVTLDSTQAPWVNGPYKVIAYSHHGVISGTESGDLVSDITLLSLNTPLAPAS